MGVLRLLLALSVVIAHGGAIHGFAPLGGTVAVQTFFMISGFYMAMILNEKYIGRGSYRLFLSNRFLRIYPMYWVVLLFALLINALIYFKTGSGPLQVAQATGIGGVLLLTVSNLIIFGQDLVMFVGSHPHGHLFFTANFQTSTPELWNFLLIPPAWSLSVELAFYILAPLLVRRSVGIITALIAMSLGLRAFLYFKLQLNNDPWTYRFFPNELAFFLAGALAYRVYAHIRKREKVRPWLLPVAVAFLIACLVYQPIPDWTAAGLLIKQWIFYCLAWGAIPMMFALSHRSKIDRYIGELSYPIYIIHYPMLRLLSFESVRLHLTHTMPVVEILTTVAASIAITWVLAVPLEKLRQKRVYNAHHFKPEPALV